MANEISDNVSVLLNLTDIPVSAPGLAGDFDRDNEVGLSDSVPFSGCVPDNNRFKQLGSYIRFGR